MKFVKAYIYQGKAHNLDVKNISFSYPTRLKVTDNVSQWFLPTSANLKVTLATKNQKVCGIEKEIDSVGYESGRIRLIIC